MDEVRHCALWREDGTLLVHETLPLAKAAQRGPMLGLQCELDHLEGRVSHCYCSAAWPPPGMRERGGRLVPAAPEGTTS